MSKSRTHVRWLIRRDMSAVLAIDHASFAEPWTEQEYLKLLRERNVIGMVAEQGDRIVGFMVYRLSKRSLDVLRFAVSADHRRAGCGKALVDKLKGKLSRERRRKIVFELEETVANLDACFFLKAQGFNANLLRDPDGDVYRFVHLLSEPADEPVPALAAAAKFCPVCNGKPPADFACMACGEIAFRLQEER